VDSSLLATLQVVSTVQGRLELRAPWAAHLANTGHAVFYLVTGERGFLQLDGQATPVELTAGSFVFVREGQGYTIRDSPATPVLPAERLFRSLARDAAGVMRGGGDGAVTAVVFGCFAFDKDHPLVAALPPMLHRSGGEDPGLQWVDASLRLLAAQPAAPRAGAFERRLAEALLIQVLRAHGGPDGDGPGLGALLDARVARALALIHERPGEAWTVAALASEVGMSRTAFATRLSALVGEPPLRHLARRRLREAARLLRESDQSLAEIADRVGYQAEAAFSRAFKRLAGVAPGAYRRGLPAR
jgi:AraC-like DNA-binding protein